MSTPPMAQNEPKWYHPPAAGAAAIVPVFYGFAAKSAKQKGLPFPKMSPSQLVSGSAKAAPTIGVIVGTQMAALNAVNQYLFKGKDADTLPSIVVSSAIVGSTSAYPLAVFNNFTLGKGVSESLKSFSVRQFGATVAREIPFLTFIEYSKPATAWAERKFGESRLVQVGVPFANGATGSLIGHAADTVLTRLQAGMKTAPRDLPRGAFVRSIAAGGFSVVYNLVLRELIKGDDS